MAEDLMDGAVEGEMRQRLTCNSCGRSAVVSEIVPPEWRDEVERVIRERPERYFEIMRDRAFTQGWYSFPAPADYPAKTIDLCPQCMVLLRALAKAPFRGWESGDSRHSDA